MKKLFFIILIFNSFVLLTGKPLSKEVESNFMIYESQNILSDFIYELPDILIGNFIMISHEYNYEAAIFPNNKYIFITSINHLIINESSGYIIKYDDKWYFYPSTIFSGINLQDYIKNFTEIILTDNGFSYYFGDRLFISMRKENMPVPLNLASKISVSFRKATHKYFDFNIPEFEMIDYSKINYYFFDDILTPHYLIIDKGIVRINSYIGDHNSNIAIEGFIEITEENPDIIKGIIKFTNGISYYYIPDGSADIEINSNGSIIISMLYIPDYIYMSELAKEMEFPARLVLEF